METILQSITLADLYMYGGIILAIYEIVARYIPTEGNWSVIHKLVAMLDTFIPNKKVTTNPTTGEAVKVEYTVAAVVKKEEVVTDPIEKIA